MAIKHTPRNDLLGTGNLFAVANAGAFMRLYGEGLVNQTFANGSANYYDLGYDELIIDSVRSQIGLISNGQLNWIAGVYGVQGYRDGPGSKALFNMWSAGYPVAGIAMVSPSRAFVSDSLNNAIRRLDKQSDGTWNVSTVYRGAVTQLTADSLGNVWFPDGGNLVRLAPDGSMSTVPLTRQRTDPGIMLIYSMCADKVGNVYWHDNINAASVFYKCGQDMVIHHVCGIDQSEMNQLLQTGLPEFMDGDANHCTFHHDNVVCASDDGTTLYIGGGDEEWIRKFVVGRQSYTLCNDGYWHSFPLRSSLNGEGNVYIFYPTNVDTSGGQEGAILTTMPLWRTLDTWGAFRYYDAVESNDPPKVIEMAEFTDWHNIVWPGSLIQGQTYTFDVAFANGSDHPWTAAQGYQLGFYANQFNPNDITGNFTLGPNESIAPGQIRHWQFQLKPTVAPGSYLLIPCVYIPQPWQLIGYGWPGSNIQVTSGTVTGTVPIPINMNFSLL